MVEKKGRPSTADRIEIKNILQQYYLQGLDAETTSKLSQKNIKTVRKYFNQWEEEIRNSIDKSFLEDAKERRQKAIMRFNFQISKLDNMSRIMEDKIKNSTGLITREYVQNMRLWQENEKMITSLTLHMINIANSPTADISLTTKADELMKKYGLVFQQ